MLIDDVKGALAALKTEMQRRTVTRRPHKSKVFTSMMGIVIKMMSEYPNFTIR